jgi:hypothetical protein
MHSLPTSDKIGHSPESTMSLAWQIIKALYKKLDRKLTAIAYAEAGNLDAVQVILDQDRVKKKK